jgi:hypothetical protein
MNTTREQRVAVAQLRRRNADSDEELVDVVCHLCDGSGSSRRRADDRLVCSICNGTGALRVARSECEFDKPRCSFQAARDEAWQLALAWIEASAEDDALSRHYGFSTDYSRLIARDVDNFEERTGWTVDEVLEECKRRTSSRWVHFSSPLEILQNGGTYACER